MKKKCGFGIATGILSIIFGIVVLAFDGGTRPLSQTYGGDAYTDIQNAAAATARNVDSLITLVKLGCGFLLIVIGLLIIMYYLVQNSKCAEGQSVVHPQSGTVAGGNVSGSVQNNYRSALSQMVAEKRDTPVASNYWTCEKCGERNPKTRMFCGSCGEPK